MVKQKKERLAAKRDEILSAAASVFSAEGYDQASMDRIAEQAGASKRTVYNHFGSKDELFFAVIGRLVDCQMAQRQIPWDPTRPLEGQLAEFARLKSAFVGDEASMALMRVALGLAIREPGMMRSFESRYSDKEKSLVDWLREADAAGAMNVPDPELAGSLFWALAGGALFWPAAFGAPVDEERSEELIAELVKVFLARYGACANPHPGCS